jgi:competence protein ComEC
LRESIHNLARFAAFNPCFVLAVMLCAVLGVTSRGTRPDSKIRVDAPAEVVAVVCSPVQDSGELEYLEVTPVTIRQGESEMRDYPARVALYVRRSPHGAVKTLLYGDVVRFETYLEDAPHFEVPGAIDFREYLWQQGILHVAHLKSPLQLTRLGLDETRSWLRPVFAYCQRFEQFLWKTLDTRQVQFILSLFLGRGKSLQAVDVEPLKRLGILHIFVVSGSHVTLVLLYFHFVFRWFGKFGRIATLLGVWAYIVLVGSAPPVLRSGVMATLLYLLLTAGVGRQFMNGLGLSALLILGWFPASVHSSSFQLSYLSLCAIGLLVLPAQRTSSNLLHGMGEAFHDEIQAMRTPELRARRRARYLVEQHLSFLPRRPVRLVLKMLLKPSLYISELALCSFIVPLLLLPVCLYYSNLWSWMQTPANLILVPLFALAVPLCLLLFLLFWVPGSWVLASFAGLWGDALLQLIEIMNRLTWVSYLAQPSTSASLAYLIAFPAAWLLLRRRHKAWALILPAGFLLYLRIGIPSPDPGRLTLTLLDVGQSECIHLRYPDGCDALVDTGGSIQQASARKDFIGQRIVSRYLWEENSRLLDFVLLTHSHTDHTGGFDFIRRAFPISRVFYGIWNPEYAGSPTRQLKAGDRFELAGVEHTVLHPASGHVSITNVNNQSVVLLVRYGNFSILLPGDIEKDAETALLATVPPVTVLKTAHHGGRNSTSLPFLQAARPAVALISAGKKNPFGHPSVYTLARLRNSGVGIICTCDHGTLRIETDGRQWRLSRYSSRTGKFEPVDPEQLRAGAEDRGALVAEATGSDQPSGP